MKNRIRELRSQRGWSQADFAERLGVARQTVNTIETGKSVPSLSIAFHIAWLFGTSIESVFPSDLEEKMRVLEATWTYINVLATALTERRALEKNGRDGWELIGFGAGYLRFRRPDDATLREPWEYLRIGGLTTNREIEMHGAKGWSYCGSWLAVYHYFKRPARDAIEARDELGRA